MNQLVLCWNRLFTQLVLETERTKKLVIHGISERVSFEMDSHAWSTTWHDTTTNNRGRQLEEYIISKQLNIINEPSTKKNFWKTDRQKQHRHNASIMQCTARRVPYRSISDEKAIQTTAYYRMPRKRATTTQTTQTRRNEKLG